MFRYIALVWNVSDEQQSRTAESLDGRLRARRWTPALIGKGLRVFCADPVPGCSGRCRSQTTPASILGTLFERNRDIDDDSPCASSHARVRAACEAILASQGRWLIENCWGNYVALLHDAPAGIVRVREGSNAALCPASRPASRT